MIIEESNLDQTARNIICDEVRYCLLRQYRTLPDNIQLVKGCLAGDNVEKITNSVIEYYTQATEHRIECFLSAQDLAKIWFDEAK